uniref:2-keto-4-pentenoate hydratase n=1 Tax=Nocardia amamiensis TaxID=404578 RepID=UPI00082B3D7C
MSATVIDMEVVDAAADWIGQGIAGRRTVAPVRELLGSCDARIAYAVQDEVTRRREWGGGVFVGRKVGCTSNDRQRISGADHLELGTLFADMDVSGAAEIPSGRLLQPRAVAVVAFILKRDLADKNIEEHRVAEAVDFASAAVEIVDSRIAGWDVTIIDSIADNASSGLFVLADRQLRLDEFVPRHIEMHMYRDDIIAAEGDGTYCLGDPLDGLAWAARTAKALGNPLCAGEIIFSGPLGPMVETPPASRIR